MIAWKAAYEDEDGTFRSWSWIVDHKPVIYKIGSASKRHVGWGPLTAFKSLIHAKIFAKEFGGEENCEVVFKCSITKSHAKNIWFVDENKETLVNSSDGTSICKIELPEGTVLCDSITPIEVVWRGNES